MAPSLVRPYYDGSYLRTTNDNPLASLFLMRVAARELEREQNAPLLGYFKDRQTWLVEPDTNNTELLPYQPPPPQQ